MRRRTRIDLGQASTAKEESRLNQKRIRWSERNKDRPDENPFLNAIKPDQQQYGDSEETISELKTRLDNLEFGNFPGYFKYRNKATSNLTKSDNEHHEEHSKDKTEPETEGKGDQSSGDQTSKQDLELGLTDDRMATLKSEWFENKHVLDIGCNRGHITYAIARSFKPMSIIGIDIDAKIIKMANRDLHLQLANGMLEEARELKLERAAKLRLELSADDSCKQQFFEETDKFPLASYISNGPISVALAKTVRDEKREESSNRWRFMDRIVFIEHNYVLASDELVERQQAHFDTIVCLSVTKWIHLNYRDEGLKRFFKRIYKHLRPNGLLILEAQPFDNYSRRRHLSDRLKANYYSIQFKPDEFDAYLLGEQVGFRQIIEQTVTEHSCSGFKRPLKVFLK